MAWRPPHFNGKSIFTKKVGLEHVQAPNDVGTESPARFTPNYCWMNYWISIPQQAARIRAVGWVSSWNSNGHHRRHERNPISAFALRCHDCGVRIHPVTRVDLDSYFNVQCSYACNNKAREHPNLVTRALSRTNLGG